MVGLPSSGAILERARNGAPSTEKARGRFCRSTYTRPRNVVAVLPDRVLMFVYSTPQLIFPGPDNRGRRSSNPPCS